MTTEQMQNYIDVALGKKRVIHAKKEPTPTEKFADKLIAKSRQDRAKMSEAQLTAARIRGC